MILLDALSIALAAFALYQVSELGKRVKALEARKPEPEKRVQAPVQVAKQLPQYEKPVVPGAKEVKPLPIGGGKQVLNYETQVAEWI